MKTNYFNILTTFIALTIFTGFNSYSQKKDDAIKENEQKKDLFR